MTELQMGLIGLGASAVVGVFAYNKWQEYRHRKLAEAVLQPHHDDVLLGAEPKQTAAARYAEPAMGEAVAPAPAERLEPVFTDPNPTLPADDLMDMAAPVASMAEEPVAELAAEAPVLQRADAEPELMAAPTPGLAEEAAPLQAVVALVVEEKPLVAPRKAVRAALAEPADASHDQAALPLPTEMLDPRTEFIVAMELVEPVSASQILRSQRDVISRLNKPVHWYGFNERNREWERLAGDSDLHLRRLRVGLQLVNRMGPVSEGDLTIFSNAMHALADELMAVADMPSSRVLDQAAEIDRFCAAVDLEIGINLVSRGPAFSGTKIRALAEAAGMVLGVDGLFTRYDDEGRSQFSLQNYESTQFSPDTVRTLTTHGLTFLLDVPRVDHGERVFMQMAELAKRFADTLQGALVDDNRQPLSDAQLDHIRREFVGKPQATMLTFGLAAGSPQARRLFS